MPSRTNTSLSDALWACALDDYYSDDEEKDIAEVIGTSAPVNGCVPIPAFQKEDDQDDQDPRSVYKRGGGNRAGSQYEDNASQWSNGGDYDLPPLIWLSVPTQTSLENQNNADGPGMAKQAQGLRLDGVESLEDDTYADVNAVRVPRRRSRSAQRGRSKTESRLARTPSMTRTRSRGRTRSKSRGRDERKRSISRDRRHRSRSVNSRSSRSEARDPPPSPPYQQTRRGETAREMSRQEDLRIQAEQDWDQPFHTYQKSFDKSYKSTRSSRSGKSQKSANSRRSRRDRTPMTHAEFQRRRRSRSASRRADY